MSEWIMPVIDREVKDTRAARINQSNDQNNKGALNYQDLNRIEGNFRYVMELLESDSFFIPHLYRNYTETTIDENGNPVQQTYTDWQEQNIPWLSEINRIRHTYNGLIQLYLVNLGLPIATQSNYLAYEEVNNWEHIALWTKEMFENMKNEYIQCGTIDSGGERLL